MLEGKTAVARNTERCLGELLVDLLERSRHCTIEEVAGLVAREGAAAGIRSIELYVVDYEQCSLGLMGGAESISVEGSLGGRAYTTLETVAVDREGHREQWVPLVDGYERLGVMRLESGPELDVPERYARLLADLVTKLLLTKSACGDALHDRRRSRAMTLSAEMQWQQLPPLAMETPRVSVAGIVEPSYGIGGDTFDYAINDGVAHLCILDAIGHGVHAARLATLSVSAYRHARRRGLALLDTYEALDRVVSTVFGDESFVTGVLAELDLATGRLVWINAGHPPPLLLRGRTIVAQLDSTPSLPMGMAFGTPALDATRLEPGDILALYTDGILEVRSPTGEFFGLERLVDVLGQQAAAEGALAERLRRLTRTVFGHREEPLHDDATVVLCRWSGV